MSNLVALAEFQFEVPPVPASDIGKRGELKWLQLSKLMIDETYQRPIGFAGKKNIRGIIEEFHWSKFAPLVVSPRPGGEYAIIDGQHHAVAAKLHGAIKEVPCWVLQCTPVEEAKAFTTINGIITKVHSQHLFKARVAANDPDAVAAEDAARAAGVTILRYPVAAVDLKPGQTLAGKSIELAVKKYGRDVAVAAMSLITLTGDGNAGYLRHNLIEGFCDCLHAHPIWARKKPEALLAVNKVGVTAIYTDAMKDSVADVGRGIRSHIATRLTMVLCDALGDGGKAEKPKFQGVEKRYAAKRAHLATTKANKTAGNVASLGKADTRRPSYRVEAPKTTVSQAERAMIEEHLKTKGARKLDSGATGNTSNLMDWLNLHGHKAQRLSSGGGHGAKIYKIDGRKYDLQGLFRVVNRVRVSKGLQPLTKEAA